MDNTDYTFSGTEWDNQERTWNTDLLGFKRSKFGHGNRFPNRNYAIITETYFSSLSDYIYFDTFKYYNFKILNWHVTENRLLYIWLNIIPL